MKQQKKGIWAVVWGGWTILLVGQIVLSFFFHNPGIQALRVIGWVIWGFSIIFGWLPIYQFRRKGGVEKGKSYTQTTVVVETGLYAIVRHPQYLAGIFINVALMAITQHWLIILIGAVCAVLGYLDMVRADRNLIEKFGDDYVRYMQRVPRANVFLGLFRLLAGRGEAGQ
jgi:protein-S-isoprenylcysteine O-methyltransferase Ste14